MYIEPIQTISIEQLSNGRSKNFSTACPKIGKINLIKVELVFEVTLNSQMLCRQVFMTSNL